MSSENPTAFPEYKSRVLAMLNRTVLPKSRKEAILLGSDYYIGNNCIRNHSPTVRPVSRCECLDCSNLRKRESDKAKEYCKERRISDAENIKIRRKNHYMKNKERASKLRKDWYTTLKEQSIQAYGGKCEVCGIDSHDVLTLDHVNSDGAEHRKKVPASGIHKWARDNGYPDSLRVLCFNCNHRAYQYHRKTGNVFMSIRSWQHKISNWLNEIHPNRTIETAIAKLKEEINELHAAPNDEEEYADVMIVLLDLATIMSVDLQEEVEKKHSKNLKRVWNFDVKGNMSHVKLGDIIRPHISDDPEGEGSVL